MNYIGIKNSVLLLLIYIILMLLVEKKLFSICKFTLINLLLALTFTYVYCELRISDSNDYMEYALKYSSAYDINLKRFEFGYVFITFLCKKLNISFSNFYVGTILICNFVLVNYTNLILRKINVDNIFIFPLLFYCSLFINLNFIILRTFIATTLLMVMLYYIIKNNSKQFIFIILAVSFHYMVIPVIFIVYLAKYITAAKINLSINFKYNFFMIFFILISMTNFESIANMYIDVIDLYLPRYLPYNSISSGWFGGYKRVPITQIVVFLLCVYIGNFQMKFIKNDNDLLLLINIIMLSFLLLIISPFPKINSRIFIYFLPVYFISIAFFSKIIKNYGPFFIISIAVIYYLSNYV